MLHLPDDPETLCDLALQRTGPLIEIGGKPALSNWMSTGDKQALIVFLSKRENRIEYLRRLNARLSAEVEELLAVLADQDYESMLLIGPGAALIETMICQHLPVRSLLLIDIEQTDSHRHGYSKSPSGYASLAKASDIVAANTTGNIRVHTCNPTVQQLPDIQADLCVSLLSMGFHYPCDTYAGYLGQSCTATGCIIMDKKLGVHDPGFARLLQTFALDRIVHVKQVKFRAVLKRPPKANH